MQLGVGKTLFPSWAASLTLVKDHGIDAAQHAAAAVRASDGATRLDAAVRAMTSFDHAIDNTRKLPVNWFVKGAPAYFRGYEAAKQAVTLLVASGVIPGAKERVGAQTLAAGRDAFLAGVAASRTERGRFGTHLASGWLEATAEDATTAVLMLRNGDTGRALLAGINQARAAVSQRRPLDDLLVRTVTDLFDRAGSEFSGLVASASARRSANVDHSAFERSGKLLVEVEAAARKLVADVPDESVFEQLPTAG